jgi:hypothetical protein
MSRRSLLITAIVLLRQYVNSSEDTGVCIDGVCGAIGTSSTLERIRERRRQQELGYPSLSSSSSDAAVRFTTGEKAANAIPRITPLTDDNIRQLNQFFTDTEVTFNMHQIIKENNIQYMHAVLQERPEFAHVRDAKGQGPMWWAHQYGRMELIQLFKMHAVSEELRDIDGYTPLDLYVRSSGKTTLVDLFRRTSKKMEKTMNNEDITTLEENEKWTKLKPSDLSSPHLFSDWSNTTVDVVDGGDEVTTINVATGSIVQPGTEKYFSTFDILPGIIPRETVASVLDLLRGPKGDGSTSLPLDEEPDSVDGMPSQEIFLDNIGLRRGEMSKAGHPEDLPRRNKLRTNIRKFLDPILYDKITPYIRQRFSELCGNEITGRACTPCYSLIRRYRAGERISHAPHHDGHSFVTVVVSLSDYGREYRGGLYVASQFHQRNYLALSRGDAVVHQSDLFHGVQVLDNVTLDADENGNRLITPERWSWILWFQDSDTCEDHSQFWHEECAKNGNPTCQMLRAKTCVETKDKIYWNQLASDNGHGAASFKLARVYLKQLYDTTLLPYDAQKAKELFQRAVDLTNEPDGHYGLAGLYLEEVSGIATSYDPIMKALIHLEKAALGGHSFSMFNLGIAHLYGYGYPNGENDPDIAGQWFEACGLPEGIYLRSLQMNALGKKKEAQDYLKQAISLGHGVPIRVAARKHSGSGGAGGVDLNLMWPTSAFGNRPDKV